MQDTGNFVPMLDEQSPIDAIILQQPKETDDCDYTRSNIA